MSCRRLRLFLGEVAMKISVISRASLIALSAATMFASPVCAQDAAVAEESVKTDDIVVTATRSETLLSKTPIAISAISGDTLRSEGITGPTDLGRSVPNLSIDRANGLQITIRGITSTDGTEKGDPSAAFLLDGVYIARPQAADVSFFDIQRVEVLRGPQGTLYGRNTTAGVVNVISNKPKLGKFGVGMNAGYGNYKSFNADGYVNVPLGDIAALRVAGSFDSRDNYLVQLPSDTVSIDPFRKNFAGRAQILIEPSEAFSVLLRADYAKLKGTRIANVRASNFFGASAAVDQPYVGASLSADTLLTRGANTPLNPGAVSFGAGNSLTQLPSMNNKTYSFEGELNYNFGPASVTYLGSYRRFFSNENQVLDLAPGFSAPDVFNGNYKQQSHELRVTANDIDNLKLQAGLYYFKEDSEIALYLFNFVGPVFGFPQATTSSSKAAYAQATYNFTPSVRLTLGGRYTDDSKFRIGHTVYQQTLTFNPAAGDTRFQNSADISNIAHTKFTWRAGLDADIGERGLAYASVATGYKAGGFNDGCTAGTTTQGEACNQARSFGNLYYQPETLTAYEIGYKGRFFDDVLRLSGDIFHYEYKNLQLSQIAIAPGGGVNQVTQNAASARVTGLELEASIKPDQRSSFDFGLTLTDSKYVAYCPKGYVTGSTSVCGNGATPVAGPGPDFAGRQLDRTPKQTVSAAYTYTYPIGGDSNLAFNVHTKMSASYELTNFGDAKQFKVPSYTKTDISLTFNAAEDRFYVQGFASNLENAITLSAVDGFGNVIPQDPRTFGVRAGFKF
jgi:iron complex outermembrane recepter protein